MEKKKKEQEEAAGVGLFQVSQKAVVYDSETKKYLMAKYAFNELYPEFDGKWGFIGGRVDTGEDFVDSLSREIIEEAGNIQYKIQDVVGVHRAGSRSRCRIGYLVYYLGGEIVLSEEHTEYAWKTAEEIPEMLSNDKHDEQVKFFIQKAEEYLSTQDALNNWKRAVAEFENYKKSKMNLEKDMAGRAVEEFAYKLLPVIDNFHASTDHIPEDQKDGAWVQGILYIQKQLEQVLGEMGIEEIPVHEGDKFDPEIHEAVQDSAETEVHPVKSAEDGGAVKPQFNRVNPVKSAEDGGAVKPQFNRVNPVKSAEGGGAEQFNRVKKVMMRGYKRGERVVRPARVIVE